MPWGGGLLIDAVIARLRPVVDEVLIVAKDPAPFVNRGARVAVDLHTEAHPWVGVDTGLRLAAHEVSFVCACDMPWLQPGVIRYLDELLEGFDAVIPQGLKGLEPFHAIYRRRCAAILERAWQQGTRTFQDLLGDLRLRIVTAHELQDIEGWERSLINLNTLADCSIVLGTAQVQRREEEEVQ